MTAELTRIAGAWEAEPTVIAGCAGLALAWAWLARPVSSRCAARLAAALGALALALLSPLDVLSDEYLFSAHMLQHVVLTFVVPPLLVGAVPGPAWERLLARGWARAGERVLGAAPVALGLALGALALWHVPALYDAALRSEPLHAFEHLTFLFAFTVFWWPLVAPAPWRLSPGAAIAYLAAAAAGCSVLGVLVTFAPLGTWRYYLDAGDPLGIRPWLAAQLTARDDQQLGGLIMWVASTPLLLGPALAALGRAFGGGAPAIAPVDRRNAP